MFGIEFRTEKSMIVYLPPEWSQGLERLIWLKYYDLVKQQITFTFGLNVGKSNELHLKKTSNKSSSELNNFYLKHFLMWCVFLVALSPKLIVIYRFSTT